MTRTTHFAGVASAALCALAAVPAAANATAWSLGGNPWSVTNQRAAVTNAPACRQAVAIGHGQTRVVRHPVQSNAGRFDIKLNNGPARLVANTSAESGVIYESFNGPKLNFRRVWGGASNLKAIRFYNGSATATFTVTPTWC